MTDNGRTPTTTEIRTMSYLKKIIKATLPLAAMLALAGAAGCNSHDAQADMEASGYVPAEQSRPEGEANPVDEIAASQIAAGARTDSTLRAYHFNRSRLNSLGREKL